MIAKLLKVGICCMPIIIVVLLFVRIVLANTLASSGEKFHRIDLTIVKLQGENELLAQQVASLSSLLTIEVRARELGFIEPSKNQMMTIVEGEFPYALK